MGMRSYGFIPIWVNKVSSSSDWVWCLQDDFFTLLAIISTGEFLFVEPMESWFVAARAVYFRTRIDKYIGGCSGDLYDLHSFSVAKRTGVFSKSFHTRNWVALPEDLTFDEIALHT
jgi:hypothetical protein